MYRNTAEEPSHKIFRAKSFSKSKETKFIEWARFHPFCLYYSTSIGTFDIELELIVKNSNHMREILDEIKTHFGLIIRSFETMRIYEEFKLNFVPWLL